MENEKDEFEADPYKVVDSPNSSKQLVMLRKQDYRSPKAENDYASSTCASHVNETNTFSTSREVIASSSRSIEHTRKTISYLVNNPGSEMELSDDAYVKFSDQTDSGKSDTPMNDPEDYMTKMENFIRDFDKIRVDLNSSKKEETDVSLELINLSVSSDKSTERKDRIEAMMSWNLDETKKFQALNTPDRQQNSISELSNRKPGLENILSDNMLLVEATSQLRTEFKQFFAEFDLKTETLKPSQGCRPTFKSSSNYAVGKFGRKALIQAKNNSKMNVLELMKYSRRSRENKSKSMKKSDSDQQILPINKHFDRDGFCIRIVGHDEVLTLHSGNLNDKDRIIRRIMASFFKTFSRSDRVRFKLVMSESKEENGVEDQKGCIKETLNKMPTNGENMYSKPAIQYPNSSKNASLGAFSKVHDLVYHSSPISSKENSFNIHNTPSKIIHLNTTDIDHNENTQVIPENNDSRISLQDNLPNQKSADNSPVVIDANSNESNVSARLKSLSRKSKSCEEVLSSSPSITLIGSSNTTTKSATAVLSYNSRSISTDVFLSIDPFDEVKPAKLSLMEDEGEEYPEICNSHDGIIEGCSQDLEEVQGASLSLTEDRGEECPEICNSHEGIIEGCSQHLEEVQRASSSIIDMASPNETTTGEIFYNSSNIPGGQDRMEETCLNIEDSEIIIYQNENTFQSNLLFTEEVSSSLQIDSTEILQGIESPRDVEQWNSSTIEDDGKTYPTVNNSCKEMNECCANPSSGVISKVQDIPILYPIQEESLYDDKNIDRDHSEIQTNCGDPPQNSKSSKIQTQKLSNIHSFPVGDNQPIYNESLSISPDVCTNLQSTCIFFDEMKEIDELMTVVLQKETDISDELEKLGDYQDFVNPLLFNTRQISSNNQTC